MKTADRDTLLRAQVEGIEGAVHGLDRTPTFAQLADLDARVDELRRLVALPTHDRRPVLSGVEAYRSDRDLLLSEIASAWNPLAGAVHGEGGGL